MPCGIKRQSAARPRGKSCTTTSICGRCVGLSAECRSMLRGLKIRSANCRSHQSKPRGTFHSFGNLKKVCKKFFCHVDMIALVAYAEQLLPRGKAAVCCILSRGIVWRHLNNGTHDCTTYHLPKSRMFKAKAVHLATLFWRNAHIR